MSAQTIQQLIDQARQDFRAGRHNEAAKTLKQAADLRPDDGEILEALGVALVAAGRAGEAIGLLRKLAELRPNNVNALHQLGDAAALAGDFATAADALDRAIALQPDNAAILARRGNVHREQMQLEQAIEIFQRSADLSADVDVLSNLGDALHVAARLDEADAVLTRAIQLNPSHANARLNLAAVRVRQGRLDEGIAMLEALLREQPDFTQAHFNLGIALLFRGDWARGWRECEWRLKFHPPDRTSRIDQTYPRWNGEPLNGRTIYVHTEQGFGDAFWFARYIPMLAERGGQVVLESRAVARTVLERVPGLAQVVAELQSPPEFDVQVPLMSLPLAFGTTLETVPATVPYLSAAPDLIAKWSRKLADATGFKVGIAWAGRPTQTRDRYRSCPVEHLAPLLQTPGVTFFSLQKGELSGQIRSIPGGERVIDYTADIHDWADTAAIMTNLDLVISVCSAPAHLAGALGRPVWTILSAAADWRWMLGRHDSPWYPTMRLFRQKKLGDWAELIQRVAAELRVMR